MFDIEEFYKARKRLFENQNNLQTFSDLKNYLADLDLVCANERSSELIDLLQSLLELAKQFKNNQILIEFYWQYFLQTYYYVDRLDRSQEILDKMRVIAEKSNDARHLSQIFQAESLLFQIRGDLPKSITLMQKALNIIEMDKNLHPDIYYSVLFSYTYFAFTYDNSFPDAVKNMEECFSYYSTSYRFRGLISVIYYLFIFYLTSGREDKIEDLMNWIDENKHLQNNLLSNLYVSFNQSLGMIFAIRNKLEKAQEHLTRSYTEISKQSLQKDMMYEYASILKFLSRCYAYLGKFNQAYELLVELIDFLEDDYVKTNFYERGKRILSINSYYTLLFIFVQLDLDIENIKDEKLRGVYEYIDSILNQSKIYEELVFDIFGERGDENQFRKTIELNDDETGIVSHQLLITHVPYKRPEENIAKIEKIRTYAFDSLYVDILLGKILLSIGNYSRFRVITKQISEKTTETKAPILKIWRDFFVLLEQFIGDPNRKDTIDELEKLELLCNQNNFFKAAEEIRLYRRLISSTKIISQFTKQIKQTAFMDIYDNQSKKAVLEYLESKK